MQDFSVFYILFLSLVLAVFYPFKLSDEAVHSWMTKRY